MLRRRYKRLVSFFVPVFFILCIIYTWSSLNVKKDVVRMFQSKHDSGLFDKIHMNDNVYNALRLHNEPEIYNISYLTTLGKIITADDQRKFDEGFHLHSFNQYVSDKLSYIRPIPDVRHPLCFDKTYEEDLPLASIVICFHNEAMSVLLRTVYSVLSRSPSDVIHEIILINDASDFAYLKKDLSVYVEQHLPIVRLIHSDERLGLIRARILGARNATGDVLIFLDSHCEVNTRWLEPLLTRIKADRHDVAIPIIDIVRDDTFAYEASSMVKGGFNWGMNFKWDSMPMYPSRNPERVIDPFPTPTMAGGLFAMDRHYFHELGEYDGGMDIWGGENLEFSFRAWMCGGHLEIVPCSRVGHVFRKRRPYGSPDGDAFLKNSLRVALVWMDGYKKYFFQTRPGSENAHAGDISQRLALRSNLNCKSFKWYLDNIYPEQLKHFGSALCLQSERSIYEKRSLVTLAICRSSSMSRDQGDVQVLKNVANQLCLITTGPDPGAQLKLSACTGHRLEDFQLVSSSQ